MKKYLLRIILLLSLFIIPITINALEINSKHAILYNLNDNTILYEKNAYDKTSIASLTKIMTGIIAIENIEDINETITITPNVFYGLAEANASVAGFKVNDKVTYYDLLMGLMLPSGADAARALAINIAGNENEFVKLMNNKATELNLQNTNFVNITGLDAENHYSTVYDVSQLLKYALENPIFKKIFETDEYITTNNLKMYSTRLTNAKRYSLDTSYLNGSKTGYTGNAGLCLSSTASFNNVDYLLVSTNADPGKSKPLNFIDAKTLYEYFFNNYSYKNIINKEQLLTTLNVSYGDTNTYDIKSPKTVQKYLSNNVDINQIRYDYIGLNNLSYKNKIGDNIGKIEILYNNELLDTIDIYLDKNINFNFFNYLIQTKIIYPVIFITIIIIALIIILKTRYSKVNKL